jgi:uncharacterized protein YbaP (TraB family)
VKKGLLVLMFCLAPLGAGAQQQEPNWASVETVEVQAPPGPALWHIARGNSEVWVLGTVGAMPSDLNWNRNALADLITGARAILMPPRPSIGILEGAWFLITNGSKLSLPHGQTLEGNLPEALRKHFIATRTAIGRDEGRYRTDTPLRAAWRLQYDFQDKTKLYNYEPRHSIETLASQKHVPIAPIAKYEILDAVKDVLKLNPAQQQACLAEEVEDIDRLSAHASAAAKAWAVGDLKTVKDNYAESRLNDCVVAAVNSIANINERNVADSVAAIDAALNQPGKTVMVIGIGPLLRKNGVLERLAAKNVVIEGPADQ